MAVFLLLFVRIQTGSDLSNGITFEFFTSRAAAESNSTVGSLPREEEEDFRLLNLGNYCILLHSITFNLEKT